MNILKRKARSNFEVPEFNFPAGRFYVLKRDSVLIPSRNRFFVLERLRGE